MNGSSQGIEDYHQSYSWEYKTYVNIRLSECERAKRAKKEESKLHQCEQDILD